MAEGRARRPVMKTSSSIVPVVVALACGALAGAFAGRVASDRAAPAAATGSALAPEATDEGAAAEASRRLADLERRVAALELRPDPRAREAVDAAPTTDLRVAADDTADGGAPDPIDLASPEFEERVATALDGIRQRERAALIAEKERVRAETLDRQLEALAEQLQLGRGQVDDLRELYHEREAFEQELTREWRDGADDEYLGARKQEGATRFSARLDEILSPAQRREFDALWSRRDEKRSGGK